MANRELKNFDEMENTLQERSNLPNCYSDISLQRPQSWISSCWENHDTCNNGGTLTSAKERKLPTRLLDIGSRDQFPRIRITSTTDLPTTTDYLTLSHC
jgi:hypothetical protein